MEELQQGPEYTEKKSFTEMFGLYFKREYLL